MENHILTTKDELTDFLLYTAPNGNIKVEVLLHNETVWLTQKAIAQLFGVNIPAISKHLNNIFESNELVESSVVSILETTASDGKKYQMKYYNLDAIISVGYRVNSRQATQFRIWATQTLKDFIIRGFIIDDERLKNGRFFGKDYFRELLERVRSIRASERRIYQQITDIFAECSIDYDPKSDITRDFYASVQNKFHFAIHGQTASEIIYTSADAEKEFMGLSTWKNAPEGRILKSDTIVAKNYLSEDEIKKLERTISAFFDYVERIIETRSTFTMEQFAASVNKFLEFNEYKILQGKGKISAQKAEEKAFKEYDKFNKTQKIESDFDKMVKALKIMKNFVLITLICLLSGLYTYSQTSINLSNYGCFVEQVKYVQDGENREGMLCFINFVDAENSTIRYSNVYLLSQSGHNKPIDNKADMFMGVYDIKASEDSKYLAILHVGEGHTWVEIIDLQALINTSEYNIVGDINPYPGNVSLIGWKADKLLIESDINLLKKNDDSEMTEYDMFEKYQPFTFDMLQKKFGNK